MKKLVMLTGALVFIGMTSQAQDDLPGARYWYSTYIHKKLNYRWSVDGFSLMAMRSKKQDFWLSQFNVGVNYRLNRFWTLSAGYGHALYKYTPWWEGRYPQEPNFLNTVSFHIASLGIKKQQRIGHRWKITNRFIAQHFFPRFEKYQTRFQYNTKFSYRRGNLPARLKPFIQAGLYYYLNGVPATYYDEDLNPVDTLAPNGLHRLRLRVGASFRPIKSYKKLSVVLYYGINKEFNLDGFGNELNTQRPSRSGNRTLTTYPFNDYSIAGLQVNLFL